MRATGCVVLSLLCGCPDRTVSAVTPQQGKVETKDIPAVPREDIDILFVIDDSGSMQEEQDSLKANFGRFIAVLEALEGGLPNVQIGVITPNLGTNAIDGSKAAPVLAGSTVQCNDSGGERGELRTLGTGGPRFLRSSARPDGSRDTNFGSLTLAQAFSQLASVGAAGCGIEQHLEAMKRALDGNPVNAGFVRPNAYLAVIVIADEDDCSLNSASLFDGERNSSWGDTVGFRCTTQGVACDTPDTPFDMAIGRRDDCHARDDATAVANIDRYVDFLRAIKPDPRDVVVAGIVGDPAPFEIWNKPNTTTKVLKHSCEYGPTTAKQFAFPAVRTAEVITQFPNNTVTTICNGDLSEGLEQIGVLIHDRFVDACFKYTLADVDQATPGPQYDCSVTEVRRRPNLPDEQLRVIPACGTGAQPCWRVVEDAEQCAFTDTDPHLKLVIDRQDQPTADIHVTASCVTTDSSGPVQ